MARIAVVGYYNQGNLGDEGFKTSIMRVLGEEHTYVFMNEIPDHINDDYDRLVIGGGSFLDVPVLGSHDVRIPYGFLGVGIHPFLHPDNKTLLDKANVVVGRNQWTNVMTTYKVDGIYGPDLLFAQMPDFAEVWDGDQEMEERRAAYLKDKEKNVLVVLNGFLMPHEGSSIEVMSAFKRFQNSMRILEGHYGTVTYRAMQTQAIDDRWMMSDVDIPTANHVEFMQDVWASDLVLSTRFHGCIYATMMGVPFVAVSPHDKFTDFMEDNGWDNYVNYYECDYKQILGAANVCPSQKALHDTAWKNYNWWKISRPYILERMLLA